MTKPSPRLSVTIVFHITIKRTNKPLKMRTVEVTVNLAVNKPQGYTSISFAFLFLKVGVLLIIYFSLWGPSSILELWNCSLDWRTSCTALVGDVLSFKVATRWHFDAVIRYLQWKFHSAVSDCHIVHFSRSKTSLWPSEGFCFISFGLYFNWRNLKL